MKYLSIIAAAAALVPFVSAHGGVVEYSFDGTIYQGHNPGRNSIKKRYSRRGSNPDGKNLIQRPWNSWDPVKTVGSAESICNDPGSPASLYASIAAGGTVSACYNAPWAHNSGPLTVYMAACPDGDCTTTSDLTSLKWFAIYKEGVVDGKWATEAYMESNSNCITHKIPDTLKAGNYLIRHETINLAVVEFYANCANVKVTGNGTASPDNSFLATISEIYKSGDSSLKAISGDAPSSYTVPGPNVWPSGEATGGQVFAVTGDKNACSGQSQSSGECADGGSDTSQPTPPNPSK